MRGCELRRLAIEDSCQELLLRITARGLRCLGEAPLEVLEFRDPPQLGQWKGKRKGMEGKERNRRRGQGRKKEGKGKEVSG